MSPQAWTDLVIGVLLGVITAVDLTLIATDTPTISNRFKAIGREVASLPFAFGALAGHFWGPDDLDPVGGWLASIAALMACTVAAALIHRLVIKIDRRRWWYSLCWVAAGVPAGLFLWPQ